MLLRRLSQLLLTTFITNQLFCSATEFTASTCRDAYYYASANNGPHTLYYGNNPATLECTFTSQHAEITVQNGLVYDFVQIEEKTPDFGVDYQTSPAHVVRIDDTADKCYQEMYTYCERYQDIVDISATVLTLQLANNSMIDKSARDLCAQVNRGYATTRVSSAVMNVMPSISKEKSANLKVHLKLSPLTCQQSLIEAQHMPCLYNLRQVADAVIVDLNVALNAPVTRVDLSFSFRTLHKNIDAFMELELQGAPRSIVTVHLKNGYFLYLQELARDLNSTMLAERYFADGKWHQVDLRIKDGNIQMSVNERSIYLMNVVRAPISKWRFNSTKQIDISRLSVNGQAVCGMAHRGAKIIRNTASVQSQNTMCFNNDCSTCPITTDLPGACPMSADAEGSNSVTLYGDELPGALILDTLEDDGRFNVFNKDIFITFRTDQANASLLWTRHEYDFMQIILDNGHRIMAVRCTGRNFTCVACTLYGNGNLGDMRWHTVGVMHDRSTTYATLDGNTCVMKGDSQATDRSPLFKYNAFGPRDYVYIGGSAQVPHHKTAGDIYKHNIFRIEATFEYPYQFHGCIYSVTIGNIEAPLHKAVAWARDELLMNPGDFQGRVGCPFCNKCTANTCRPHWSNAKLPVSQCDCGAVAKEWYMVSQQCQDALQEHRHSIAFPRAQSIDIKLDSQSLDSIRTDFVHRAWFTFKLPYLLSSQSELITLLGTLAQNSVQTHALVRVIVNVRRRELFVTVDNEQATFSFTPLALRSHFITFLVKERSLLVTFDNQQQELSREAAQFFTLLGSRLRDLRLGSVSTHSNVSDNCLSEFMLVTRRRDAPLEAVYAYVDLLPPDSVSNAACGVRQFPALYAPLYSSYGQRKAAVVDVQSLPRGSDVDSGSDEDRDALMIIAICLGGLTIMILVSAVVYCLLKRRKVGSQNGSTGKLHRGETPRSETSTLPVSPGSPRSSMRYSAQVTRAVDSPRGVVRSTQNFTAPPPPVYPRQANTHIKWQSHVDREKGVEV